MDGALATISQVKHELRTPINHIIGYSEILAEEIADAGGSDDSSDIERIIALGKELIRLIDVNLVAANGSTRPSESSLSALRCALRRPVEEIRQIESTGLRVTGIAHAPDIEKIREASDRLLTFVETGRVRTSEQPASHRPAAPEPCVGPEVGVAHLLVVDDNENNRDLLRRRGEMLGYRISLADHGGQAVEMMQSSNYDLILLDILMPEMDGYEVLQWIRSQPDKRDTPVVIMSALDEVESVARCLEMGADDYMVKPFQPVLLRARIGACLERAKLRSTLVMQQKLASLGALAAGIAHEIKNPLNFINNFSELSVELLADLKTDLGSRDASLDELIESLESNLERIRQHGLRADGIVRGMLLHSRNQAGERQSLDVNQMVSESVKLAYQGWQSERKGLLVAMELDCAPDAGSLLGVASELSRALINLTTNALHAADAKVRKADDRRAAIHVSTRNRGSSVEIRVRDNGNGVPSAIREKIFQPFFTTKPAGQGTGLGLSLTHGIVVQGHRGALRLETEEGRYAEFIIQIPRT
jgi:signal transduction histidine kinase